MAGRAPASRGSLRERVVNASSLLNELGGLSEVDEEDGLMSSGAMGAPLRPRLPSIRKPAMRSRVC